MRIRSYKDSNYKSVFFNGKTVRMKYDKNMPMLAIPTPELEDVAINSKCFAACSYCYTSAMKSGNNFKDIIDKANNVWGSLDLTDRPFQIAIGGAGESTIHPDWVEFVTTVNNLGIMPNYTTNGMHLSENILRATEDICGGVAVSWHPHIHKTFHSAMDKLSELDTKLNTHVIIGDENSLEDLKKIYYKYNDVIDYFVVLPYMAEGRAKKLNTHQVWKDTFDWIKTVDQEKFAFGALFYDWFLNNDVELDMSIYEPEVFSGYRMLDDNFKKLYKSSYDLNLK